MNHKNRTVTIEYHRKRHLQKKFSFSNCYEFHKQITKTIQLIDVRGFRSKTNKIAKSN